MCAFRYRRPLEPGLKIAITLRYLATGDSFQYMEFNWRTAHNTIGKFIPEVCDVIVEEYASEVFRTPTTTDGWQEIAKGFQDKWNFPHVLWRWQACSHPEAKTEWQYLLQLQGVLQYCHPSAHVGSPGSESDCGTYNDSPMFQGIQDGTIKLPPSEPLPNDTEDTPYLLRHRGWRIPPTSAHAKAVFRAIHGEWAARLQLPAVTCQTGCRKPLWYTGSPILMPLTHSRDDTRESCLSHQGMSHLAQSLGLNIFYFIYMKRDWAEHRCYVEALFPHNIYNCTNIDNQS